MSIEKKSLISTLKTTKKANVASSTPSVEVTHKMTKMLPKTRASKVVKAHKTVQKTVAKMAAKVAAKTVAKMAAKVAAKTLRA